jgi:phosphoribosylformylglycinamidine (FGAM) synthase PurS component
MSFYCSMCTKLLINAVMHRRWCISWSQPGGPSDAAHNDAGSCSCPNAYVITCGHAMTCNTVVGRLDVPWVVLVRTVLGLGLIIALPFTFVVAAATSLASGAMGIVQPAGVERPVFTNGSSVHPGRGIRLERTLCGQSCVSKTRLTRWTQLFADELGHSVHIGRLCTFCLYNPGCEDICVELDTLVPVYRLCQPTPS